MDLLSPMGRTAAERKTEVISRTDLQEEPASFSAGIAVTKGGLFSESAPRSPRIPISCPIEKAAGAPRPFQPLFSLLQALGALVSVQEKVI